MKKIIFFISLIFISQTASAKKINDLYRPSIEVPLFSGSYLKRSFEVVGKAVVEGATVDQVKNEMRRLAEHHFGDAVLEFRISEGGGQQIYQVQNRSVQTRRYVYRQNDVNVVNVNNYIAEGVIIKFERAGINEITEEVPVAALE